MRPGGLAVLAALILPACEKDAAVAIHSGEAMGTTYRIKTVGEFDGIEAEVRTMLDGFDRDLSTWRDDSWVMAFNRAPAGTTMEMPANVATLIRLSAEYHEATGGCFDPTIGALLEVWGFGAWRKSFSGEPDDAAIEAARGACGFRHLRIEGSGITKLHDGLMLDFSAIAKGHAVDRIGGILRASGCRDFVIEIGGDLLAAGHAPGKTGWTIDGPALDEPLVLVDEAIATSGSEHQFRGGHSHIIDPRSGRPAPVGPPASARAPTCAEADARATAAFIDPAAARR